MALNARDLAAAPLRCLQAHAAHPDWRMALALAAAQIEGERARRTQAGEGPPFVPSLGLVYFSDRYADEADGLLDALRERWPGVVWAGASSLAVAASGVEYWDEAALVLMLVEVAPELVVPFSGARPLPAAGVGESGGWSLLVHADPRAPDLPGLLPELAQRAGSGRVVGGVLSGRQDVVQIADGVFRGGLSGLALHPRVAVRVGLTHGCTPVGPLRRVTRWDDRTVLELDGQPAMACLFEDLGLPLDGLRRADRPPRLAPEAVDRLRLTLAALTEGADDRPSGRRGVLDATSWVRHLVGLDPARQGVVLADSAEGAEGLAFCRRDAETARRDLLRMVAELRDDLTDVDAPALGPSRPPLDVAGAVYISCVGRGGPHFGGDSAELQWLRHALGEVPLVGFFAGGEFVGARLHGYSGVLALLLRPGV